ncbi:major facilitator superfamily domain-containing protein 3-like [Strongylocentrotus purpuratus]|uniref:Major facilitator superfamily domain-containing protein 3 n=1 Tax=Strongylocentrotus purpuratus TaxID=7668 RepID=A0A7M7NJD4_STRPU|nr:major facilitator superfamily domain-containing protein 3-like [Strongylocentrotus purpuratus]
MEVLSSNVYWLMLLYGLQGVPYGFQVAFLPILMHTAGASLTKVSLLRALSLPWMLKLMWVPVVTSSSSIKRPLTFSLSGLSVVFAASSMISVQSAWTLSIILLTMNILVSVQDIAVDTFAIQNLTETEMGMGNAIQVVAYKVGAMFGGGMLTWASQFYSWSVLMTWVATVYLITVIVIYLGLPTKKSDLDAENEELDKKNISITADFLSSDSKNLFNHKQDKECLSKLGAEQDDTSTYKIERNGYSKHQVVCPSHGYNLRSSSLNLRQYTSPSDFSSDDHFRTAIKHRRECVHDQPLARHTAAWECGKHSESHMQDAHQGSLYDDLASVLRGPGMLWLLLYLLIYKLGEQGAISIFPMYLLDCDVTTNQVAFWTGLLAQCVSISGSLLGGWLLNHNTKHRSLSLELGSLCFWRFIALSILSFMIWLDGSFNPLLLCLPFYLILLLGGAITTATFTLMMTTSQRASQACVQTLTHTTMATAEVLGKVIFTALAGLLVDHTGYVAGFIIFANLSMLALLPIYKITIFAPKGTVPS